MTSKEYLSQARYLDMRINSKLDQIESLHELATRCTSTISGMPHNPNRGGSPMADAICKIIDLESEINADIDKLVDLKREIVGVIKRIDNVELQTLLEKRYLCFMQWEQTAVDMCFSIQHVYRLHDRALKEVEKAIA